jgi:hypothetical protein
VRLLDAKTLSPPRTEQDSRARTRTAAEIDGRSDHNAVHRTANRARRGPAVPAPLAFVAQPEVAQRCPDKWSVSRFRLKRYRQSVRRSRKRVGSLGVVKCAAGAAFSPAGGAVILRTLAHVRVGDAAIQADTAVLRALRKDTLCGRRRAADARSVNPRNPL